MTILRWSNSCILFVYLCSQQYYQPEFDMFQDNPEMAGVSGFDQNSIDPFGMDQQPVDNSANTFDSNVKAVCY